MRFGMTLGLAIALIGLGSSSAFAQGRGPGGPGGGFGGGGSMALLEDENIRKELEIVDSQEEKIKALRDKIREEMRSMFQGGRGGSDEDREQRFAQIRTKMEGFQKELDEVLLPQQRDRLKQIALQARLRFQSTSQALASDDLAKELGVTDEQKEKLKSASETIEKEMQKEMEKVREKYRDKLLENLTPEQQAKFKAMFGKPAEFSPRPQFGGGRGTRGPGGPPQTN